jgi:hypothetical protein
MTTNQVSDPTSPAAETPQPAPMLAPEQVVERLRALGAQIPDVTPLTAKQKRALRRKAEVPSAILQASINVIGASDLVSQGVGRPAEDVRQLVDDANRWTAVEDDLRKMLNGVAGGNLVRRQRAAFIAGQAYAIASRLARDPAHDVLVPHVQEIKRLKSIARRKKTRIAPQAPETASEGSAAGVSPEQRASETKKS